LFVRSGGRWFRIAKTVTGLALVNSAIVVRSAAAETVNANWTPSQDVIQSSLIVHGLPIDATDDGKTSGKLTRESLSR